MTSMNREYIVSERFILDDLLKQAEAAVRVVYETWKKERKIAPVFFTWPAERIYTDRGDPHEGICFLALPENDKERSDAMLAMVRRTKAYALLLIEQQPDAVRIIFESKHGSRCWNVPIANHGDVVLLEAARAEDNTAHVGLLWSPKIGQS